MEFFAFGLNVCSYAMGVPRPPLPESVEIPEQLEQLEQLEHLEGAEADAAGGGTRSRKASTTA